MALNRQMLHNSLLRVQQHIASTGNTFKVAALNAMGNANEPNHHTIRKGSSFHQHSSSSDSEDETLKKNPYYTAYAEKLRALKKYPNEPRLFTRKLFFCSRFVVVKIL